MIQVNLIADETNIEESVENQRERWFDELDTHLKVENSGLRRKFYVYLTGKRCMEKEIDDAIRLEEKVNDSVDEMKEDEEGESVVEGVVVGVEKCFRDKYNLKVETPKETRKVLEFRESDLKDTDSKIRGLLAKKGISPENFGKIVGEKVNLWDGKELSCPQSARYSSMLHHKLFSFIVSIGLIHSPSEIRRTAGIGGSIILSMLFACFWLLMFIISSLIVSIIGDGWILLLSSLIISFVPASGISLMMGSMESDAISQVWDQTFQKIFDFFNSLDEIE